MSEDELSYKTLELIRPDLFAQVVALAQTAPPDSILTLNGAVSELATSALRWMRKLDREQVELME